MFIFEPNNNQNRLMYYNWQQESWPTFEYNVSNFEAMALSFREFEGQSVGILGGLTEGQKEE